MWKPQISTSHFRGPFGHHDGTFNCLSPSLPCSQSDEEDIRSAFYMPTLEPLTSFIFLGDEYRVDEDIRSLFVKEFPSSGHIIKQELKSR